MAGNYPDPPAVRLAYHRDGTAGFKVNPTGNIYNLTQTELEYINSENGQVVYSTGFNSTPGQQLGLWRYGLIFPELRDISAWYNNISSHPNGQGLPSSAQWSNDSTTGLDGTWTDIVNPFPYRNEAVTPSFRSNINALELTGVKAFRWNISASGSDWGAAYIRAFHLYGAPTAGQTRYLAITDDEGTEDAGTLFEFSDTPRGESQTKTFKVKNLHGTLTANSITVSLQVLTDKATSFADDYELSADGETFDATASAGTLAPGVSSGSLHLRKTTPSDAVLGVESGVVVATAGSWS